MKLAGVMIVRNEDDILRVNLAHHLPLVDAMYVLDNGSTDTTPRLLRSLSRRHDHLVVSTDPGPFLQSTLTTRLARRAAAEGADWIVAIDADELWLLDRPTLEHAAPDIASLEVPVLNFVQARWVTGQHRRNLLTMTRRSASPVGPPHSVGGLVTERHISFVEGAYPPKRISRASSSLVIETGNHDTRGLLGVVVAVDSMLCLHAPLRSREGLLRRVAASSRLDNADFGEGQAWQARRWGELDEEGVTQEWAANSYAGASGLALDVHGYAHELVVDCRLRDAVLPHTRMFDRVVASLAWRVRHRRWSSRTTAPRSSAPGR